MGADEREHDLVAAMTSMRAGDDAALETALGFGPQDLATTVFNAGASVFARRAGGRNYYESGPQPLDLLDDGPTPTLPEGFLVMAVTLWGSVDGREFRVDYAFDESGLVNLDGVLWQATTSMEIPPRAARYPDPQHALPGWAGKLAVEGLLKPAYWGAKFRLVAMDGTLQRIELGRDERGWALCDGSNTSLQERLGSLRDERLEFIRRRANDFRRTSGRWPRGLHELTFAAKQLSDPTSDLGRLGWADYEASPAVGFEVAPDEAAEYAAACTQTGPAGRRAIRRDGSYFWLEP
ncbi:MAG: hypothetical protein KDB90_15695 [Planctomycetes bacterium]|nr:hypothetical protein [Planctomycetota bacterium]